MVDKRVIWHGLAPAAFDTLVAELEAVATPLGERRVGWDGACVHWVARDTAAALLGELAARYVNLVVLDLRPSSGPLLDVARDAFEVLDALDRIEDVEGRFAFDKILVLLPDGVSRDVDELVLALGARGVRHALRLPSPTGTAGARTLCEEVGRILRARKIGKRALCASGGGITGLYFELGALKCLDDCLPGAGVNDFDMYFGISAGAVVSGPLAVGYSVDEYMAAIAGVPGGRMPRVDLRLFRLDHVDAPSHARRLTLAARTIGAALWSAITGRRSRDDELLLDYADLVAAPFRADSFERLLRQVLEAPGATNDFRKLPRPLYVGATDQDSRTHVVFGDEDHLDVPVSLAIQASLSLNPAFGATLIGGRYYEDGAVTRTSNFVEAIRRGATLVTVLDPVVPYVSRKAGFASRRGILYNVDQDIRTISFTRYDTTRRFVMRQHPEVSAYTFVPQNRLRRLMSVNPMNHRPWREIFRGGYLSMWSRLRVLEHRLAGDFAAHGLRLDLTRATEVAHRLERLDRPELADFFPGRDIVIKRPPLCLEPRPTLAGSGAAA